MATGWPHLQSAPNTISGSRTKGSLAGGLWKGQTHERWQYEVTGGDRIRYLIDDERRSVWITYAGSAHPREGTDGSAYGQVWVTPVQATDG